jgi:hypothetical protein
MLLKYVGSYPVVTHKGVSFDSTKPDKYTFFNALFEILEIVNSSEDRDIIIDTKETKHYTSRDLIELLKEYCLDIDSIIEAKEKRVEQVIDNYSQSAKSNTGLSLDEKSAILGNISIMRDYYKQYMINEKVYEVALEKLADILSEKHIDTITFVLGHNYGMVLSDLILVLQEHKPPYDATMEFFTDDNGIAYGKLNMNRN